MDSEQAPRRKGGIVDCDVHNAFRAYSDLHPYLSDVWKPRVTKDGIGGVGPGYFSPVGVMRRDARPDDGGPEGSDPALTRAQLLDAYGIDYAILTGQEILRISTMTDPNYAAALARAYNDYLIEKWLPSDPRFLGAMTVATQNPLEAAKEIDRIGGHPRIVEVLLASATKVPYGQRQYWPIYEAAEHHRLPVAIHPGTEGSGIANPPTSAGYPSTYLEWHTDLSQNFMAQTVSIVCEGVFVQFPELKLVLIEGGVGWLPHLMWRLDKNYKALRAEVPWLTRLPSEYIKEHVRLTTQPIEEPASPDHLLDIFEMIDAAHTLVFSSDYPHWDFDDPFWAFRFVPEDLKRRIFSETARELYHLPESTASPTESGEAVASGT
ncbi:MAG: amidohydrolase family protein [Chloroflexota bacterium]